MGGKKHVEKNHQKKRVIPHVNSRRRSRQNVSERTRWTGCIIHKFYDAYVGFAALNKTNFSTSSLNLRRTRCSFETLWITMRIASQNLRLTSSCEGKYLHTWRNVIKETR